MIYTPRDCQAYATQHILDNPAAGLFLEMGLGKTVSTFTALDWLMYRDFEIGKTLVIAPKRVAEEVWTSEAEKWEHLHHFKISLVLGTQKQRKAALMRKADVYVINRENVPWLVSFYSMAWPFDMVVIDELSSFKNPRAVRFESLRTIMPLVKRVVGLTGTPAPNGLIDLWPQLYLLDQGQRLYQNVTRYRETFFVQDYVVRQKWYPREGAAEEIYKRIGDICISMKAEDYITLPPLIDNVISIPMPPEIEKMYDKFEEEQVLRLGDDENEISAINAAALYSKLLQFANGAIYDDRKNYHEVHQLKIDALEELLDTAAGNPVLLFYEFQHDVERIKKYLKAYQPYVLHNTRKDVAAWNKGQIPFMIAHPASAGHGLNMQEGGNITTWFGRPSSLEFYEQALARLRRPGQTRQNVISNTLALKGTLEFDVIKSLSSKQGVQNALMQAVKARVRKWAA